MKELTNYQKKIADRAVSNLHKLQDLGVEMMILDGGGGNCGLTFWRPSDEERRDAYNIVGNTYDTRYEEFNEKYYYPAKSIGLRIDCIVP